MAESPEEFVRALALEDRVLLDAREQLYGGAWEDLEHDLRARKEGKPYIFKLASKIEEDLGRIVRLKRYEAERGVDLGEVMRRMERAARSMGAEPEVKQ